MDVFAVTRPDQPPLGHRDLFRASWQYFLKGVERLRHGRRRSHPDEPLQEALPRAGGRRDHTVQPLQQRLAISQQQTAAPDQEENSYKRQ